MNEKGKPWTLAVTEKKRGNIYIHAGGERANGLKAGDSCTFKLVHNGKTPVLRLSKIWSEEDKEASSEDDEIESLSTALDSDEERNLEMIQRKKNKEKEAEPYLLNPSCFVAKVSPATLRYDTLYLPRSFARANGIDTRTGEVVLMNKEGKSWTLDLKRKKHCGTPYIRGGWRSFCLTNGLKAGGSYTFKLIQRGGTPVLRLLSEECDEEEESSEGGDEIESLSTESENDEENGLKNRFVTLTVTPDRFKKSRMVLPIPFTRFHGINEETKMTLLDKNGMNWCVNLRSENKRERIRLVGLKEFFKTNFVKIGDTIGPSRWS